MGNELVVNGSTSLVAVQRDLIGQPTPAEAIKVRKGRGGQELRYVDTQYMIHKLNEIFGYAWSFESEIVSPWELIAKNKQIIVKGKLSAYTPDGKQVIKEQFGSAEVKVYGEGNARQGEIIDVADDCKAAGSDALKKCASLFGIASDVYSGGYNGGQSSGRTNQSAPRDAQDSGKTKAIPSGDWEQKPATDKQVNFVKSMTEKLKVDVSKLETYLMSNFGVESVSQLKSGQITGLIDWLRNNKQD